MINFENLDHAIFDGAGAYNIPQIEPEHDYPAGEFIASHFLSTEKNPGDKIVHFFEDDYRFIRFWNFPNKYVPMLSRAKAVFSPDFSMYTDMPKAMQIYNHYRKHWLGAYWQMLGITVYPTISWSTPDSYEWCFDGEPVGSIVAVSSVGTQADKESKRLFLRGYEEMMKRLDPSFVIFYGKVPEECDWNVIRVKPRSEEIKEQHKISRYKLEARQACLWERECDRWAGEEALGEEKTQEKRQQKLGK